jgi:hypothetical protein
MSARLRASATQIELRPVIGSRLTGFASRLAPSVGSHDPLMAKLLWLDDGSTRIAWIVCDLIGFSTSDDAELRKRVAGRLAMPSHHVLVSCTHTHSGPSSMPFRGTLGQVDRSWLNQTFDAIIDAAATLPGLLCDVSLQHATIQAPNLGYNRQDGESAIDERLLVAQLRDDDGRVVATVLNYATHPVVVGEQNLMFSADYPGYATRAAEEAFGGVAIFVLGSAGDVDPVVYRDIGRHAGTFEVARKMGEQLATAATRAIAETGARADRLPISVEPLTVRVPLAPPPTLSELDAIKQQIKSRARTSNAAAEWEVFELAWASDLERAVRADSVQSFVEAMLTAARIGPMRIVALPFEPYSQIGLDIRSLMSPQPVINYGYTNGLIGYAPTDRAIDQGGYGPALSYRFFPELLTPVGRGAHAALVDASVALLRSLT